MNSQQRGIDVGVGVQIQNLRIFRGLSAPDLATLIRCPEDQLGRWEKGDERVPPMALLTIADALDVSVSKLFEVVLEVQQLRAAPVRH